MDNVGTPGTGIGTYLYVFLGLCMPFYELYQTILGRSSIEKWKHVLRQFSISLLILAGAEVTFFLALEYFEIKTPTILITLLFGNTLLATIIFIIAPLLGSWSLVFLVLTGIRIWAFVNKVRSRSKEESVPLQKILE